MFMKKELFVQTKYGNHMVVFEHDERRGYIAVAPTLPGVITWGKNITHAKEMVKEAIELCIESLVEKQSNTKISTSHVRSHKSQKVFARV